MASGGIDGSNVGIEVVSGGRLVVGVSGVGLVFGGADGTD